MDLQSFSFHPLFSILLIFTILIALKFRKRSNSSPKNLPPGPWKLPIIGNIHQMFGSLPHHRLRDLAQKCGPLMHIQLGEISTVVVSSAELAREVMKLHDLNFAYRPPVLTAEILIYGGNDIAFSPHGKYWRQLRKICSLELLSRKRVRSFQSVREDEILKLVDLIASDAGSEVNLTEKLLGLAYTTTARVAFGKKNIDQDKFIVVAKQIIKYVAGFHVWDVFPSQKWLHVINGTGSKLEKVRVEADRVLSGIIQDHQERREKRNKAAREGGEETTHHEDLVDVLLKCMEHEELGFSLTLDNVKAVLMDMFIAGSDTTATTVGWVMAELLRNPKIMHKTQTEIRHKFDETGRVEADRLSQLNYLQMVIKETLRFHPPLVLLLPRECKDRCEIGGFEIPMKTKMIVNAWAIGRDPNYWTEPDIFNPERFLDCDINFQGNNFELIPFGSGRRMCPGMLFSLANVEYQLATLLYYFDWKLPIDEELDMTEEFGATVAMKQDLRLIPTVHRLPLASV